MLTGLIDKPSSISEELRRVTSDLHRATEALPSMATLLDANLDRATYATTQARFYGVLAPLESSLGPSSLWHNLDMTPLDNARHLAMDLDALGLDPDALPIQKVIQPNSVYSALGRAYVLEGSAMGVRYIDKQLRYHSWYEPSKIGTYFSQVAPPNRWRRFKTFVDNLNASTPELDYLFAEAVNTFQLVYNWMEDPRNG